MPFPSASYTMQRSSALDPPEITLEIPVWARPFLKGFQRLVIANAHHKIRKNHTENLTALENTLATLSSTRKKFESAKLAKGVPIFNLAQFAFLVQYDVSALAHDALLAKSVWRRKLYCRLLAVTLIESVEDLTKLAGWEFTKLVDGVYSDPSVQQRLLSIRQDLHKFLKKYEKMLRDVRQNAAAHRDHDATKQLQIIESLDCDKVLKAAQEFVDQNKQLLAVLYYLVTTAQSRFLYFKML
jgi:hypothetical protein